MTAWRIGFDENMRLEGRYPYVHAHFVCAGGNGCGENLLPGRADWVSGRLPACFIHGELRVYRYLVGRRACGRSGMSYLATSLVARLAAERCFGLLAREVVFWEEGLA